MSDTPSNTWSQEDLEALVSLSLAGKTMREAAESLGRKTTAVMSIVSRLRKKGLDIRFARSPHNGRKSKFNLEALQAQLSGANS